MGEVFVIRDDTSLAGMRRQHLMQRGEFDLVEVIKAEIEAGWRLETWYQWKDDELDLNHITLAWRSEMVSKEMMVYTVGKGGMLDAIQRAARLYEAKFGMRPNMLLVREETWATNGADQVALQVNGGLEEVRVRTVKKGWQQGVVGVWKE